MIVANMQPLRDDRISSIQDSWAQQQTCPGATLTLDLPSLELTGPALDELDLSLEDNDERQDEILKEWVWKTHKEEIWKHIRVRGHKAQKVSCDGNSRNDSEIYKKRLELTHRVARATQHFLQDEGPKVVYQCLLNGLLELEESEYAFIGEVHCSSIDQPYIQIHSSTIHASRQAQQCYDESKGHKLTNMTSLFGQILTERKPIIVNDVSKNNVWGCLIKQGLPSIESFLGLPLYGREREIIGVLCIGNKKGGYNPSDAAFLEPFTAIGSNLIQAYGQLEENRRLCRDLEAKVQRRTLSLQQRNEQLEQANQLLMQTSNQQLQQFACMSHELRTPLNCIIGLSSLLEGTDMTSHQQENMKLITTSGNLLLNVINDVLDFSKLATGNLEIDVKRSSLQDALDATVHAIDMKARTRYLRLKTVYDPHLPEYIETDTHRLQQILFNLLGNAVKFSKEGGEIELHVSIFTEVDKERKRPSFSRGKKKRDRESPVKRTTSADSPVPSEAAAIRMRRRLSHLGSMSQQPALPILQLSLQEDAERSEPIPASSHTKPHNPWRRKQSLLARPKPGIHRAQSNPEQFDKLEEEINQGSVPLRTTTPKRNHFVRFVVRNYGKGIQKSELQNIFQPFRQESVQIERDHGGTGLGLSITAKIVEALGGRISADSQVGEWTEFTVDIPFRGACAVKPFNLGRKLGLGTVVNVVGQDTEEETNLQDCFEACGIACGARLDSSILCEADRVVFLVHEDEFDAKAFRLFTEVKPQTTLISYGHSHSVAESAVHIRSPAALLSCVLVGTIESALDSSSDSDQSPRQPRRSAKIFSRRLSTSQKEQDITGLRVLVAEDNQINQKVMARMLQRLGIMKFDMVDNGQKAVEKVSKDEYDVVLMDMQMPVMDGIKACEIIVKRQKKVKNQVKVVFVSANISRNSEIKSAGAWDCIPKPFKLENIRDCLQRVAMAMEWEHAC